MWQFISKVILKIWGFQIEGDVRNDIDKKIFAVAPHTSSWDFPLGILTRGAKKMKVNFLGKMSLFKPPLGFIFRGLGGYPVDRSKHTNMVDAIVEIYTKQEKFALAIAPEGTRKKVDKLKTGFYYIALKAKIPIIVIKLDYGHKVVGFSKPIYPTGDLQKDFTLIYQFLKGVKGKNPELSFYQEST